MKNYNTYELNIDNLIYNVNKVRSMIGKSKLCAMVKADGYGHGVIDIAKELSGSVDYFGVATVFEAIELREAGINDPIVIVGKTDLKNIEWCVKNNIDFSVSAVEDFKKIAETITNKANIHIKINTGMNRFGLQKIKELKEIKRIIKTHKNLKIKGIFTHFATKEEDRSFIDKQHSLFMKYVKVLGDVDIVHCCNSFATTSCPLLHHDMVRCGFCLYGWQEGFKPVLSIKSKLITVYKVKAGESVGYDRTFIFKTHSVVGVVPIGYADGFDRRLSNNFKVIVNGQWVNVIGRVCMDVFMVDLSNTNAVEGDTVTILGKDKNKKLSVHNYARALNTSDYEILLKFRYHRMNKILIRTCK